MKSWCPEAVQFCFWLKDEVSKQYPGSNKFYKKWITRFPHDWWLPDPASTQIQESPPCKHLPSATDYIEDRGETPSQEQGGNRLLSASFLNCTHTYTYTHPCTETGVMCGVSQWDYWRSKAESDIGTAQTARSELSVSPTPVCSFEAILSQADIEVSSLGPSLPCVAKLPTTTFSPVQSPMCPYNFIKRITL